MATMASNRNSCEPQGVAGLRPCRSRHTMEGKTMLRSRAPWLVAALIVSTVLTTVPLAQAQTPPPSPRGDRMFSRLQQNLGLTDDQVTQIRAIFAQQRDAHRNQWQGPPRAPAHPPQPAL